VDHHRKDAKVLVRAFRAGDRDAVRRAERVLGERARTRFLLSDAQHVVAFEHGYRTWADLKRAAEREERLVDTGLEYAPGDPVLVRVVRRGRRVFATDGARAAGKAGRAKVPEEIARRIEDEFVVDVSRQGEVFLWADRVVERIANASLALYQELLDSE
jgi:hypothetical protein